MGAVTKKIVFSMENTQIGPHSYITWLLRDTVKSHFTAYVS
jgi:hypothetical protein